MLLKVFTKRSKGGEPISTEYYWKDHYFEGPEILVTPNNDGTFTFCVKQDEDQPPMQGVIDTSIQGWEIRNSSGVVIEKYVTPVES